MKQYWIPSVAILSFLFAATSLFSAGPSPSARAASEEVNATARCLKCHGPFDKLASAPPGFVAPSGEKITPHRYVPHDAKEIPDCLSCHRAHSANPTGAEIAALPKPGVKSCYECHHKETFERCKDCHNRR